MKVTNIRISNGYIYADIDGETREVGIDRTFGIRNPLGAAYRCHCGGYWELPRHIATHLTNGNCPAL